MDWILRRKEVTATRHFPATEGTTSAWPTWLPDELIDRIRAAGVEAPWRHQVELADLARRGEHVAIATPTGSGKSLAYWMPVIAATHYGEAGAVGSLRRRLGATRYSAVYISPTKALAHDQLRAARSFAPPGWAVSALDGDSDTEERRFARDQASVIVTNPDMLHFSVLPHHDRWARLLRTLRYIVIDEAHRYQGIFGAHVSQVVRRLRRLCAHYGAHPTVILSSATIPNADVFGAALVGETTVSVVSESTAPRAGRTVALWQPCGSARQDVSELLARCSDEARQTLAFIPSRVGAELVSVAAQDRAAHPERIASYRSGYLAMERRALEAALHQRAICGLATTNALELGIDVAGIDAVLIEGFPGRRSAFWQQAGRAGRAGQESLAVLLASDNPLDAYYIDHPEALLDEPVEDGVLYPDNPHVVGPHLAAAAQELAVTEGDDRWFGPLTVPMAEHLVASGLLRDRGRRWFWVRPERAVDYINLRATSNAPIDIVEEATGALLGVVDDDAADRTVFPGAVYLHQGSSWMVRELDRERRVALVKSAQPGFYTQAQGDFRVQVVDEFRNAPLGNARIHYGRVQLTSQVTGYLRRDETTHEVWDSWPLEMPRRVMHTHAVWWEVPPDMERALKMSPLTLGASLHAAEHTSIGILPVVVPCDRGDIGGLSTALHEDTGLPTVFVYDGLPGGAGFAQLAFQRAEHWLHATLRRLVECDCVTGCPACVVSPKCGNANSMLDKAGAIDVLRCVLGESGTG